MPGQSKKPKKIQARLWLFPLGVLYAIVALPLSVLGILGQASFLPQGISHQLASPFFHAHELIFGFAFAVISGYLLGSLPRARLLALILCWLLARLSFWLLGFHLISASLAALTALLLGLHAMPSFWKAKKWQNKSVAVITLLFGLMTTAAAANAGFFAWLLPNILILLASLMFFMGGRIITPLLSSYWLARGIRVGHNNQPRIESAGLILLGLALLLQATGLLPELKGLLLIFAGLNILIRLLRWSAWQYLQLDIIWLFLGYLGLATGVLLLGLQEFLPKARIFSSHSITLAAMGVLMVSIMARINIIKAFKDVNALPQAHLASGLLVFTALTRIAAPMVPKLYQPFIHLAMLGWCLGFALLLWVLWRCQRATAPLS